MENNKLDMNLQLLADNEGGEEPPQDNHIDNTNGGEGGESKVCFNPCFIGTYSFTRNT